MAKASFQYAVRYDVTATCRSPLRTGGTDGLPESILHDLDGVPFIQASSIAGVLRSYLQDIQPEQTPEPGQDQAQTPEPGQNQEQAPEPGQNQEQAPEPGQDQAQTPEPGQDQTQAQKPNPAKPLTIADAIFGSQGQASKLTVSDGCFCEDVKQSIRPRLRIDPHTGSAADKGKFDVRSICADAQFQFSLLLKTEKPEPTYEKALKQALAAMNAGELTLGAQRTNGFGRVSLVVKESTYDMTTPQGREDWMKGRCKQQPVSLEDETWRPRMLRLQLAGSFSSLLVKSGHGSENAGDGNPAAATPPENGKKSHVNSIAVVAMTDTDTADGTPVIPGSSFKGALRARVRMIADFLGVPEKEEALFGSLAEERANPVPGRAVFSDTRITAVDKRKITRIRIDRFTGGVMDKNGALITEQPVSGQVKCAILLPGDDPLAARLVLYALRDMADGFYNLGSGWAIGRGFAQLTTIHVEAPDGREADIRFGKQTMVDDGQGLLREIMGG